MKQLPELEPPEAEESETFKFVTSRLRFYVFLRGKQVPGDGEDLPTGATTE